MNNTIIIQTTNQKQSEKILKWKQFGKLNIKTYPHPHPKLLERSYKIPRPHIVFP